MTAPRDASQADVYRGEVLAGTLTRTRLGAVFEYAAGFPDDLALHLPRARGRFESSGVNLPPFFAGLLPEGLRLRALRVRLKTSEDDLFSLLLAAGADCVGDVSVVARGEPLPLPEPSSAPPLEGVLFSDLFEQSLARAGGPAREEIVPGVQAKISGAMISFPVRLAKARAAYILKLNPADKPTLVANEAFFMRMARACGLEVANTRVVHDREGHPGLLVERFDRVWSPSGLRRIHQEDGCQLLDRYPADKYRVSCRELAEGLGATAAPVTQLARLLELVAFSSLIGNGDLHARNLSVGAFLSPRELTLTPAYDLLTTWPYGDRRLALKLNGKDGSLRGRDFVAFGARFGLKPEAVKSSLERLYQLSAPWLGRLGEIGFGDAKTAPLAKALEKRREDLVRFGKSR